MAEYTNAKDFLGSTVVYQTPGGKKIYFSDIGNYRLKFYPKKAVKWVVHSKTGTLLPSMYSKPGVIGLPITNSYWSNAYQTWFIEFDAGDNTYRAEFTPDNFDLSPVESLPSVDERNAAAAQSSQEANEAHYQDSLPFPENILYSLKKAAKPILLIGGGLLLLNLLRKR